MSDSIKLLYVGLRESENGKLYAYYYKMTQEEFANCDMVPFTMRETGYSAFDKKVAKRMGVIGGIYDVPTSKEGKSIVHGSAKFVCMISDVNLINECTAASREAEAFKINEKDAKTAAKESELSLLRPFRQRYGKLIDPARRAALLASIIEYVTRRGGN